MRCLWLLGPDLIKAGGFRITLFAGLAAALPMLHYAGIVSFCFLPALALSVPRSRWRVLAAALGAATLPLLMWSPVILGAPTGSMRWVDTLSGPGRPGLATIEVLAPAGPFPVLFEAFESPVSPSVSMMILGALAFAAIVGFWMRKGWYGEDGPASEYSARLGIGLVPAVCVGLISLVGLPIYFAGRTEVMVWTLAAGLVSTMLWPLSPLVRRTTAGAYVVVGGVTIAFWLASMPQRLPAPGVEVGRVLAPLIQGGDRVVVAGLWQLEVQHGLAAGFFDLDSTLPARVVVETIPRSQAGHPGWLDLKALLSPELILEARKLEEQGRRDGQRIWLVWSPRLPLEETFFPAFESWKRATAENPNVLAVDLLLPPTNVD